MTIDDDYISGEDQKRLCEASGADLWRITTFEGSMRRNDGTTKEVAVKIWDRGPEDTSRWMVTAEDEDGNTAAGNANEDLGTAIAFVHWADLNAEPPPKTKARVIDLNKL
jgi:hypothetical protein